MSLVTLIVDASHCPDTKVGGYGYWVVCDSKRIQGGGALKGLVVNSTVAEMMAVVNGLFHGLKGGLIQQGDNLIIQTDCEGAITSFTNVKTKNKESDEAIRVKEVYNSYWKRFNLTVEFRHVAGHSNGSTKRGYVQNFCDREARRYMRRKRKRINR